MAYSIDSITDDCYEGTTCLINKLDIHDEGVLAQTEAAVVLAKLSYLDLHPIDGNLDLKHLCDIHRFLFSDLYAWAGQLRKVNISKKGTAFAPAEQIETMARACFGRISRIDFSSLSRSEFVAETADFYNTLNIIHPFRDGNGRAQRAFFTVWLRAHGYDINFADMEEDAFMIATIRAARGVMDDLTGLFDDSIVPYAATDFGFNMQQTM